MEEEDEGHYLLEPKYTREMESASDEEWSENSSENSYYSDSDSSIPEWESSIEENGNLLYIDCNSSFSPQTSNTISKQSLVKGPERKSSRGKFLRLIRRRDSKRRSKRFQKTNDNENKVTFCDQDEGEVKIVNLQLDTVPSKLGRRGKLVEVVLGINTSTFSDGNRIMVAGFTPEAKIKNDKNIKIGDWLKSINNVKVTTQNICHVLEHLETCDVRLELQCVTGVEVTKQPTNSELANQSDLIKQLTDNCTREFKQINHQLLFNFPIAILYLDTETLSESSSEFNEIIYSFPSPHRKNPLCLSRGVFITLTHIIHDITKTLPKVTTVKIGNKMARVIINKLNKTKLLVLMLPSDYATFTDALFINVTIIKLLNFMYENLDNCFLKNNGTQLDTFFLKFFTKILCNGFQDTNYQLEVLNNPESIVVDCKFEQVLPAAHFISLPREAQMQIDDALSELEASDYRDWNEDPLDCQRLFTMLGSALYHGGYLISSHLIHDDLIDIHQYCREQGFFHLSQTESLKNLIHWRQVYPASCKNMTTNEKCARYLLVVGSLKDILVVLMEAGGCTEPPEDNLGPDAFYVEEAQATLAHVQQLGISELTKRVLCTNPGTQVDFPSVSAFKKKTDFLGNFSRSTTTTTKEKSPTQKKQPQVTSILKRKHSDLMSPVQQFGSLFSIPDDAELHSEDSVSQSGYYSERSEMSDEPVVGRRALRERNKNVEESDEEDEESDIDDYREGSQLSTGSFELSELRGALLNDNNDINPIQLNAGDKVTLYHYVQLDFTRGIFLAPPNSNQTSSLSTALLNNFKRFAQHIHQVFENSFRFKAMPSQNISKSVMNKSLIAIKEYGTMFDINFVDETTKKSCKISYWIIGKLFHLPQPKELYVCYDDSIPQNMVDIAFKLGISASI